MRVTLNISKDQAWSVVDYLDKKKYLCLDDKATSRVDLILFAIALGFNRGYPSDRTNAKKSIVRTEYFSEQRHLFSAIFYHHFIQPGDKPIDAITDGNAMLTLAENFAETGFEVIKEKYETDTDETFCYELISQMDEWYETYFG
jgi:hypothetical protein